MVKKIVYLLLVLCLLFPTNIIIAEDTSTEPSPVIKVYVEDNLLQFDVNPVIINGRTMVPMRAIFEALGAAVNWESETQSITATRNDKTIIMQIDNNVMQVNGNDISLDVAPMITEGRTLVPLRAVAESLGVCVYWRGEINTVLVYENENNISYIEIYNPKGELVKVGTVVADDYYALGWSRSKEGVLVTLYAPDGSTKRIFKADVDEELENGWYLEPVYTMYSTSGQTVIVTEKEVNSYKNKGWSLNKEDVCKEMYCITGSEEVYLDFVDSYKQKGWQEEPLPIKATDTCSFSRASSNNIMLHWSVETSLSTIRRIANRDSVERIAADTDISIKQMDIDVYIFNSNGKLIPNQLTDQKWFRLTYNYGGKNTRKTVGFFPDCGKILIGNVQITYEAKVARRYLTGTVSCWSGQIAKEGDENSIWDGTWISKQEAQQILQEK